MKIALITPAYNEALHLPELARSIRAQTNRDAIYSWHIVDDQSTDRTWEVAHNLDIGTATYVHSKPNDGGLAQGSAFSSFFFGADIAVQDSSVTHVMKLDADVVLSQDFFEAIASIGRVDAGLLGGVAIGASDLEQTDLVPGFCKVYSRQAYFLVRELPAAIGLDVIDQTALQLEAFPIQVVKSAHVTLQRSIGHSAGLINGRRRNGKVSRWVGYDHLYFSLRLARYLWRPPVVVGTLHMLDAYLRAGKSPYPDRLRKTFRRVQRRKLFTLISSPIKGGKDLYRYELCADPACPCSDTR